jgi:hypothetical protein
MLVSQGDNATVADPSAGGFDVFQGLFGASAGTAGVGLLQGTG